MKVEDGMADMKDGGKVEGRWRESRWDSGGKVEGRWREGAWGGGIEGEVE